MKELGICIGSLVELKYCDFNKWVNVEDPELNAITKFFYIDNIIWKRINRKYLDMSINTNLVHYFANNGYSRNNFGNMILVNPDHPNGYSVTLTLDKLYRMKTQEFSLENNVIGDFMVHDPGSWTETQKTIPAGFLDGKVYKQLISGELE